jgi:serine/threonine protein kinase
MAKQSPHSEPLTVNTSPYDHFSVGPRFANLQPIGCGANGLVFSATDGDTDKNVALKKISFHDSISCKYALREIKIMRRIQHENVVAFCEVLGSDGRPLDGEGAVNYNELRTVYIVQELLDTDLHRLIQSHPISEEHAKFFQYQILRGLKYIHSANVLHRDLKPSNILINCDNLLLKIADFGLSRVVDPAYNHNGFLTENMGTCWYKSPEMILTPRDYSKAIDIWAAGCIFAEMLTGRPLFPGVQ